MTSADLKNLLHDLAGPGAETVDVGEIELVSRIRRRRRLRTGITGMTGAVAVTAVAVGAYAALPGGAPVNSGGSESAVATAGAETSIAFPATPFRCGAAFPAASSVGGRSVTLTQQSIARSSTGWAGTVRSRYFNPGNLPYPLIAGLPPRNLAVVADGKMVGRAAVTTTAKPVELKAGASNTLTVRIDIRSCASDPLPAGSYLLYEDSVPSPGPTKPNGGKPMVDTTPLGRIDLR